MPGVLVDRSYRTMLGTGFYDRAAELGVLESLLGSRRLVIVYGPRNVGKSELVRYYLRVRRSGGLVVSVDSRLFRARSLEDRIGAISVVSGAQRGLARTIIDSIGGVVSSRIGLVDLLLALRRIVEELRARLGETLLFVDEFHEMPGYAGLGREEALGDLRSLAALLSKSDDNVRVVVTVSEGFAASLRAHSMLEGYSADWLLVEHLDRRHFQALYEEYRSRKPCNLGFRGLYTLVGGTPGVLPDLCPLTETDVVERRIPAWIGMLEGALLSARAGLERHGLRMSPAELVGEALSVMEEPVKPLLDPRRSLLAEELVEANIVYPKRVQGGIRYPPQYPVYRAILREAARQGAPSLLELDPYRVYQRALEED